jgi:hypothetical protein
MHVDWGTHMKLFWLAFSVIFGLIGAMTLLALTQWDWGINTIALVATLGLMLAYVYITVSDKLRAK